MFRASMRPSSVENYCIYATLALVTVWVASGRLIGVSLQPAYQTPPIQSDKFQCRIDTVISPDDERMDARNM